MDGTERKQIQKGSLVLIVKKEHQQTNELTEGIVAQILTKSQVHPRGIKVRLESGEVGRLRLVMKK